MGKKITDKGCTDGMEIGFVGDFGSASGEVCEPCIPDMSGTQAAECIEEKPEAQVDPCGTKKLPGLERMYCNSKGKYMIPSKYNAWADSLLGLKKGTYDVERVWWVEMGNGKGGKMLPPDVKIKM